jgi:hypothetical protein
MKERPILFSGEMVRAILEGRKTQTRRIVKNLVNTVVGTDYCFHETKDGTWELGFDYVPKTGSGCFLRYIKCPYGKPGDRLWVRETWSCCYIGDNVDGSATYEIKYKSENQRQSINVSEDQCWKLRNVLDKNDVWQPSIHIPRIASRILLEVVSVRVERLQDISEEDAKLEGFTNSVLMKTNHYPTVDFRLYWDLINGKKYPWDANHWVWVIEFKKVA